MTKNPDAPTRYPLTAIKSVDANGRLYLGREFANEEIQLTIEDAHNPVDFPVMFGRTKVALSTAGRVKMLSQFRFGVDWSLGPLAVDSDYDRCGHGAKSDRNNMKDASNKGALVFITDRYVAPDRAIVGPVMPGTPVISKQYEHIDRDKDGKDGVHPEEDNVCATLPEAEAAGRNGVDHERLTEKPDTKRVYMKTLQLDRANSYIVHEQDDDVPSALFDLQARPRGTLREWSSQADLVRELFKSRSGL